MTDIISNDIFDKQSGNQNTDDRIDQIEVVDFVGRESWSKILLDKADKEFQYIGWQGSENPHEEADNQDEMFLLDMLFSPEEKAIKQTFFSHICIQPQRAINDNVSNCEQK